MFRSLFAKNGVVEYDFGSRVVAMRTKKEVAADQGGTWLHRAKVQRLGNQFFLTGEWCDSSRTSKNPYIGVVFWYRLSEIGQLREYASFEQAMECWQWSEKSSLEKDAPSGN